MMKILNFIILIVFVGLIIFAISNWHAIITPIPLSLLFMEANAPLGLILLTITGLLALLFLGFVVYMQSSTLMLRKRLNRELEAQRKLAEEAEASRITELKNYLQAELQQLSNQNTDIHQKTTDKITNLETTVKDVIEETGSTLTAYIGEIEDKLEKKLG
ncbi:MAG TPA: LapA family protein [Methylophilaceae bacterium]|nr:LapA family protein [Methylophilaceae bacterium]